MPFPRKERKLTPAIRRALKVRQLAAQKRKKETLMKEFVAENGRKNARGYWKAPKSGCGCR